MKKSIKLHWASSKPNFGDSLSPLIVECISGRKVVHSAPGDCDLIAIGSLLQRLKNHWWNRRVHVWGTGFIEAGGCIRSRHHIHALRGPLSSARLSSDVQVFGDPGLLADRLLDGRVIGKKYRVSIIAHYKDRDSLELKQLVQLNPDARLIDVFSDPLEILSQIAASHFVASSSMHGLIAADALGVPNARIVLSGALRGGDFKFEDYYQGIKVGTPKVAGAEFDEYLSLYSRPGLEELKGMLARAFPDELL